MRVRAVMMYVLQGWQMQAQQLAFGTGSPEVIPGAGKTLAGQEPGAGAQDLALERAIQVRALMLIETLLWLASFSGRTILACVVFPLHLPSSHRLQLVSCVPWV
jgi:hypothetical protein